MQPDVPAHPGVTSSVAAILPTLALVAYHGKFYLPGGTLPDLFYRRDVCDDLALLLVPKYRESNTGKGSHMSATEVLDQYPPRLLKTGRGSTDEMRWVSVARLRCWGGRSQSRPRQQLSLDSSGATMPRGKRQFRSASAALAA